MKPTILEIFAGHKGNFENIKMSKEYKRISEKFYKANEEVSAALKDMPEIKTLYNNAIDIACELDAENAESHYLEGFRLGIALASDALLSLSQE